MSALPTFFVDIKTVQHFGSIWKQLSITPSPLDLLEAVARRMARNLGTWLLVVYTTNMALVGPQTLSSRMEVS